MVETRSQTVITNIWSQSLTLLIFICSFNGIHNGLHESGRRIFFGPLAESAPTEEEEATEAVSSTMGHDDDTEGDGL